MDDLLRWLGEQLDEDERIARRAFEYASPEWHLDEEFGETVLWWPPEPHVAENERKHGLPVTADRWRGMTIDASGQQIAPHIATHDPARVLREIDAKRELLRRYEAMAADVLVLTSGTQEILSEYRRVILPSLAAGYSDRPGFREEWRP